MRKAFGIICLALALFATVNLVKSLAKGTSTRSRSAAYDSGRKVGAFTAPIVFGALAIWLLRSGNRPRQSLPPPFPTSHSTSPAPAVPFLKRKSVWLVLSVLLLIALCVVSTIAIGIVSRMRNHRPVSLFQPPGQPPGPTGTPFAGGLQGMDLQSRAISFTNLHGRVYSDVKLLRTDGIVLFVSRTGGHTDPVFLNQVPLPVLIEIGIPTNWPGVMQGRPLANTTFLRRPADSASSAASGSERFSPGQVVEVRWGGGWQSGTVLASRGFSVQVQLQTPANSAPIWISTNRIRIMK